MLIARHLICASSGAKLFSLRGIKACQTPSLFRFSYLKNEQCRSFSKSIAFINSSWYKNGTPHRKKRIKQVFYISLAVATVSSYFAYQNFEGLSLKAVSLVRSARSLFYGALIIGDYKIRLEYYEKVCTTEDEYREKRSAIHTACANRLLKLCRRNGGVYIKAGQHLASLNHALPREYTSTLAVLEDSAPYCEYNEILPVFEEDFHCTPDKLFSIFEHIPLASASLAQVHRAVTLDGEEVAVKVQYPFVRRLFRGDMYTMELVCRLGHYFFPDLRLQWIVEEFEKNLLSELDFVNEAKNAWETSERFKSKPYFHIPRVRWDLTTPRVLTMEYIHGIKITDIDRLKAASVDTIAVAKTLAEIFGEMIFVHGRIHGDPHPGNMLVRLYDKNNRSKCVRDLKDMPLDSVPALQNGRYELVLLDHGLYRSVEPSFRVTFCHLWKSLIFMDERLLKESSHRLGAGQYYGLFPLIFTSRLWSTQGPLGTSLSSEDQMKIRNKLKTIQLSDVMVFLETLPRDMFLVVKMSSLVSGINTKLGFAKIDHFRVFAKYALKGIRLTPPSPPAFYFVSEYGVLHPNLNMNKQSDTFGHGIEYLFWLVDLFRLDLTFWIASTTANVFWWLSQSFISPLSSTLNLGEDYKKRIVLIWKEKPYKTNRQHSLLEKSNRGENWTSQFKENSLGTAEVNRVDQKPQKCQGCTCSL